jgi:hypothetical protein
MVKTSNCCIAVQKSASVHLMVEFTLLAKNVRACDVVTVWRK